MYHRRLIIHLIYLSLSSLLFMMDHHIALGDLTNDQTTCTIAVLDSSRSIMPSWAFLSGSEFSTARELLNNHEYFGPDGIIHQSFQIMEINSISNQSLAGIELFIFSPAGWVTGISADEVGAVERYVQNGGCLLEIRDNSGRPSLLGLSAAGQVSDPYAVLTERAADTPIINGPFGIVTSPIRTGYNGYFNYDPEQVIPLASNVAGPMMFMVSAATGANFTGRAVIIGDEELFQDQRINELESNRILWLNIIAYLTEPLHQFNCVMQSPTPNITSISPIPVTVHFARSVIDFDATDVMLQDADLINFTGEGTDYSFKLVPRKNGVISAQIPAGSVSDDQGCINIFSEITRTIERNRFSVWVDFNYHGNVESGSEIYPFNTLVEALDVISWGGVIHVKPGGYTSESPMINKFIRIETTAPGTVIGAHSDDPSW